MNQIEDYQIKRDLIFLILEFTDKFKDIKSEDAKLFFASETLKMYIEHKLIEFKDDSIKLLYWQKINQSYKGIQ